MDSNSFELSQEHRMVLDATRSLLRRLEPLREEHFRLLYEEQRFPEDLWRETGRAGIFGALIPEEYGGTGLGLLAMTLALEVFAEEGLPNTLALLATMDTMAILRGGTEEQKRHWLPQIANGSLKLAFAVTEPDSGTNTFAIHTLARREGSVYRLSGQKAWITAADIADYILVVARTMSAEEAQQRGLPKTHGLGLFLVDAKAPNLTLQRMDTMGIEGFQQFFVFFDGVDVPIEQRLGEEHMGAQILFAALNPERILAGAFGVGMSAFALRRAAAYARERRIFGDTPIAAYQGVQHPLARAKMHQEAARLMTYRAAAAFDRGLPPAEVGLLANMAKYLASEVAVESVDHAIQTLGGSGFVKEHKLISMWAPARLMKTVPINNEMILNYVAENALGLPRSY